MNMDGDQMDVNIFIKESIKQNQLESMEFLSRERIGKIKHISQESGLPSKFKDSSFKNYDPRDNPLALQASLDFVKNFPSTRGLLLSGPPGLGKSHLAAAISRELNHKLYSSYFGNIVDIIGLLKSTYSKNSSLNEEEAINLMTKNVDLLIIDDLGRDWRLQDGR